MKKKVLTFGNNFKQIQNKFVKTPAVKPCIIDIIVSTLIALVQK